MHVLRRLSFLVIDQLDGGLAHIRDNPEV